MIVLDNGDAIRAIATVADVVDFTLNGYVGIIATQLADGQLGTDEADLYTSGADGTVVLAITLVNTHSAAVTCNLYLKPSSGTSRRIIAKDLSLPIGNSLHTDGTTVVLVNNLGQVVYTYPAHSTDHEAGGDDEIGVTGLSGQLADDQHIVDAEAVSAMGAKADGNPLHHDRPDLTAYVAKTLFDPNTILKADSDNTPVVLTVAASRILGRKAAGGIVAMTGAELLAILSGQAGANFAWNAKKLTGVAEPTDAQDVATKNYVDTAAPGALPRVRSYLAAVQANLLHGKVARVEAANTSFDTESAFKTDTWQAGVGDGGSNATTIIDADPTTGTGFVASMRYALVTWDAGASSGYIASVDSGTQVTIGKNKGTNFTAGDTYTIKKAHYEVPTAGYWLIFGMVGWLWSSVVADIEYVGGISVNGAMALTAIFQAAAVKPVSCPFSDIQHFDEGDIVAMIALHYAIVSTVDVNGGADGRLTYLAMALLEAD